MKADPTAQARLLDLQEVDTTIARLQHKLATLPQLELIQGSKSKWAQVSQDHVRAETEASDAAQALRRAESDLLPVRERLTRNQQRVDAGEVGDPKALKAMVDEIEHLKIRIATLEDAQLEAMELVETTGAERDRTAAERRDLHAAIKQLMAERDEQGGAIQADIDKHRARRDAVAADLPADLLAAYEKAASRLGGSGAAKLEGRRCSGCGLEANSADFGSYQSAAADDVLRCEECGRILVR